MGRRVLGCFCSVKDSHRASWLLIPPCPLQSSNLKPGVPPWFFSSFSVLLGFGFGFLFFWFLLGLFVFGVFGGFCLWVVFFFFYFSPFLAESEFLVPEK